MAVFFQKISDKQFNIESEFVVRESKGMNLFIGIFCLIMAAASAGTSLLLAGTLGISAFIFLAKAGRNQVIMNINKKGFYYYGTLLTTWNNFVDVEFLDEIRVPDNNSDGLGDNFSLRIKYYKDSQPGCYARKIPLTNTQDKAEEEIIAAIKFYYRHHQQV